MTVSDFWHESFLAALARLPAPQAKAAADRATELAIQHWEDQKEQWGGVVQTWVRPDQLDITHMGRPAGKRVVLPAPTEGEPQ